MPPKCVPKLSLVTRNRLVEELKFKGWNVRETARYLNERGYQCSPSSVCRFFKHYDSTGSINRADDGRNRRTHITFFVLEIIQGAILRNREITSEDLQKKLSEEGYDLDIRTVIRARRKLGWVYVNAKYCQHIRKKNVILRKEWAIRMLAEMAKGFNFDDVIFSDESKIQLERYTRKCYRRIGEPVQLRPKFKHPVSVMVWGGISRKGATALVIFTGIMDAQRYVEILQHGLLPFAHSKYGPAFRFMQDNDPKHTSRVAQQFYAKMRINWWKTPAESPDINPIENLWAELKHYIRKTAKPTNLKELVTACETFWGGLTPQRCCRYIDHLKAVIPRIVRVRGYPTGF